MSATSLTATVPATLAGGSYSITVKNGAAGTASNAVTLTVNNPLPVITALYQTHTNAGASSYVIYATGTGFVPGASSIVFGALTLPASLNATGYWYATVPGSALTTAGVVQVALKNAAPAGGTSSSLTFTILNPAPTLTSISPASIPAGVAATITLTGTGFNATSVAYAGASALTTTFVSATSLTATIPAAMAGGTYLITVKTPAPGGGTSGSQTLSSPAPTLTTVAPSPVVAGGTITLTGSNFASNVVASVGTTALTTTYVSGTSATAVVPASVVGGSYTVTAKNGSAGTASSAVSLSVNNPVPVIQALFTTSAPAGASSLTLYVKGTGFVAGASNILFGALTLPASVNATGYWYATVPGSALATASTVQVSLKTAAPGGGTSGSLTFSILNAMPALSSISPSSGTVGTAFTITLTGTGYNSSSVAYAGSTALATTYVSATSLTATVPASFAAGAFAVKAWNPTPGGGFSAAQTLTLVYPTPTIASVSPNPMTAGTATTVTLTGTNFIAKAVAYIGATALTTTYVSPTSLTAVVPATVAGGSYQVTVKNGTVASSGVPVSVVNPLPVIASLYQTSTAAGAASYVINVKGTGYVAGASSIVFGALTLPASVTTTGYWYATVPGSALTAAGPVQVALQNAAPGGGTSGSLTFTINNPLPTLSAISPASIPVGAAATITLAGTGYNASSVAYAGTTALATTFVSATSLTATVPAGMAGGTYAVTVKNPLPGGGTSGAQTLTSPAPTLTTVTPSPVTAGGAVTLTGTNIASNVVAYVGTTALATTYVSGTSATAVIPATMVGGSYQVTVKNGATGTASNAVSLSVSNPVPVLQSLYQTSVTHGAASLVLYVKGTGFVAGASSIQFGSLTLPASINGTGYWYATVPGSAIATPQTVQVSLQTAAPGGGTSAALAFTVR